MLLHPFVPKRNLELLPRRLVPLVLLTLHPRRPPFNAHQRPNQLLRPSLQPTRNDHDFLLAFEPLGDEELEEEVGVRGGSVGFEEEGGGEGETAPEDVVEGGEASGEEGLGVVGRWAGAGDWSGCDAPSEGAHCKRDT